MENVVLAFREMSFRGKRNFTDGTVLMLGIMPMGAELHDDSGRSMPPVENGLGPTVAQKLIKLFVDVREGVPVEVSFKDRSNKQDTH